MYEIFFVFENLDVLFQCYCVECLGCGMEYWVIGFFLCQNGDGYIVFGCCLQGKIEMYVGYKVGVGNQYFVLCCFDGFQIGMQDVVVMFEVVVDQNGGEL